MELYDSSLPKLNEKRTILCNSDESGNVKQNKNATLICVDYTFPFISSKLMLFN